MSISHDDSHLKVRTIDHKRLFGQTYTPPVLARRLIELIHPLWMHSHIPTIMDMGIGSGRLSVACLERWPTVRIHGWDIDQKALDVARSILGENIVLHHEDWLLSNHVRPEGSLLWIANPPYTRHRDISSLRKQAYIQDMKFLGIDKPSLLAGLHAHFAARILRLASQGDVIALVMPGEWTRTRYGADLRHVFLEHGLATMLTYDPHSPVFDADSTACLVVLTPGQERDPDFGWSQSDSHEVWKTISRQNLINNKWDALALVEGRSEVHGVRLGDIFKVSRGAATGCDKAYVMTLEKAKGLGVEAWWKPCLTCADDVIASGGVITNVNRGIIELPDDAYELPILRPWFDLANSLGVESTYTARSRKPWWRPRLPLPSPLVVPSMARGAPCFALNPHNIPNLATVYGLKPKHVMDNLELAVWAKRLNTASSRWTGRTYSGGLKKFEPGDYEDCLIPEDVMDS
jgi:adenine-specific DNA-methyltransferase